MNFANVFWAGTEAGRVFIRDETGTITDRTAALSAAIPGGGPIHDIAVDPDDYRQAFALKGDQVAFTTDAGANWTEITDNGGQLTTELRSLALVDGTPGTAGDGTLVAGGLGGVFRRLVLPSSATVTWSEFGIMPNSLVQDLDFVPVDPDGNAADGIGILLAGTFGRGAWTVPDVSATVGVAATLQITGDDVPGTDDTIRLVRDPHNPLLLDVFVNNATAVPDFSIEFSILQAIQVNGLGGSDTLIGDFENGPIVPVAGIAYTGGIEAGTDALRLEDGAFATAAYTASGPGAGAVSLDGSRITYSLLDPVLDLTLAANRVFTSAIPGAQTIRIVDDGIPANGRSRIDDGGTGAFETITFANPTTSLTVNAGDGNDIVTLLAVDSGFAASVMLNGQGDGDRVIVAAAPAATQVNGGPGDDAVTVNFGSLAGVVTVAGGADTDSLLVNGTAGGDPLVFSPGAVTRGAETVNYLGLEELTVDTDGGNDTVTVNGTQVPTTVLGGVGDDTLVVSATGAGGPLSLDGGEDSDTYTVNLGSLASPVTINDTGTMGTDTLGVNGTPGDDTIILTDSGVSGSGGAISFMGIENLVVDAGAGNDLVDGSALTIPVTIFGGTADDILLGGAANDSLFGQEDDDDLVGGLGADLLDGGAGSDGLVGDKGTIARMLLDGSTATSPRTPNGHLTAEIDQAGTLKRNVALQDEAMGGNDTLLGGAGDDFMHGGAGNDVMDGGDDKDALFGNLGDDAMGGGSGGDHLYGGGGNDTVDGGAGADIAYGGDGDDRLVADSPDDRLIDWFGNFNNFVVPGPGYGGKTIVRSPSPWVRNFLLALAEADGALDPNGEIALVIPGSADQQNNSGEGGRTK